MIRNAPPHVDDLGVTDPLIGRAEMHGVEVARAARTADFDSIADRLLEGLNLVPMRGGDLTAFLCHSSQDKEKVRDLYRRLTNDGVTCWFDEEDLIPGQDWDREIRQALGRCRYVLACLSSSSVTTAGYVQTELKRALDRADEQPEGSIYLVPVRLEPCDVPGRLQRLQRVDLFDERGYDKLVRALRLGLIGHAIGDPDQVPGSRKASEDVAEAPIPEPSEVATDVPSLPPSSIIRTSSRPDGGRATHERGESLPTPEAGGDGASRKKRSSRLWLSAAIAAATVLVVAVAAVVYQGGGDRGPQQRPDGGPTPSTPATAAAASSDPGADPPAGGFVLFDDFSGASLDPARWIGADAAAPVVSVVDGALRVEAPQGTGEGTSVDVEAVLPRSAEAVRFLMTVRRIDGKNDGGAHVYVAGAGDRFHEMWGGPNGDGAPTIGYAICQTDNPCSGYDAFTQRGEQVAPIGRSLSVVVRRTDQGWQVDVDGRQWTLAAVERGPIERLTVGTYSFGEGFRVDLDDPYISYS
jgi:hypothetical protein